MKKHILIVEDESDIASALCARLKNEGFLVTVADNGIDGADIALEEHFDVAVLDVMLPGQSGLVIAKILKDRQETAVLVLSARDEEQDIINGLNIGADDYVTKPFSIREVVARIHALIRRTSTAPVQATEKSRSFDFGDLVLDASRHYIVKDNKEIHTTPTEFRLLSALCSRPGVVHTREELVNLLSANSADDVSSHTNVRTVDSHIRSLRKKIGPEYIRTVHGLGYSFEKQNSPDKASA